MLPVQCCRNVVSCTAHEIAPLITKDSVFAMNNEFSRLCMQIIVVQAKTIFYSVSVVDEYSHSCRVIIGLKNRLV